MSTDEPFKTALITGVRGQDGSYLAEHLTALGYRVVGTSHEFDGQFMLPQAQQPVEVRHLDLTDTVAVTDLVTEIQADEIYNLGARSSSTQLFDDPLLTAEVNGLGCVRLLDAIRKTSLHSRFCQAASSEVFAATTICPQDEDTPFRPDNAYGAAKTYAANMVIAYRERHGLFATTAILYNHESPRRGLEYVTRKITNTVAQIACRGGGELILGDLDCRRDWGFAGDYARAMYLMLQPKIAEDYVISTGQTHSVREFCEIAFSHVALDYRDFVQIDPEWSRPPDRVERRGSPAKAFSKLGWRPSMSFADLVKQMVDADLTRARCIDTK
ncbi:MAG: GDP-mannose 4,6-dehydratase [Pseudomonadota bacterium]